MVRNIIQIGDPKLYKVSEPVKDPLDKKTQNLVQDLIDTCNSNKDLTAGLSAPQLGVNSAVIVCRRTDLEEIGMSEETLKDDLFEAMINPEIYYRGKKFGYYWEGCLSIGTGDNALFGPVKRVNLIKIRYINRKGEHKDISCKGFFAHVVQHEVDHLEGILFLKYINNPKNIWKIKDLDKYLDEYGEYPPNE